MSTVRPLASSMFAPGVPEVMREFGTSSNMLATFVVSVFVLGFAFGPLVIAPLSELYGRRIVYHVCNAFFVVFLVACALSTNMDMLIAFRFFDGFAGVAVITSGSGTIADIMPQERRGGAMAIWSLGPLLGPVVGPVCAGFLVEALGWRWVFWVIAIVVSQPRTPR
jgi:multidrug resistance protein